MTRFYSPSAVLLVAAGILTPTAVASAGGRPYGARGTAQFVSPTDFVGSGHAPTSAGTPRSAGPSYHRPRTRRSSRSMPGRSTPQRTATSSTRSSPVS